MYKQILLKKKLEICDAFKAFVIKKMELIELELKAAEEIEDTTSDDVSKIVDPPSFMNLFQQSKLVETPKPNHHPNRFNFETFMDVYDRYKDILTSNYSEQAATEASREIYEATNGAINVSINRSSGLSGNPIIVSANNTPLLRDFVRECGGSRNNTFGYNSLPRHIINAYKFKLNIDIEPAHKIAVTHKDVRIDVRRDRPHLSTVPLEFDEYCRTSGLNYLKAVPDSKTGKIKYLTLSKKPYGAQKVTSDRYTATLARNGHGGFAFSRSHKRSQPFEHMLNTIVNDYKKGNFQGLDAQIILNFDSEEDGYVRYKVVGVI